MEMSLMHIKHTANHLSFLKENPGCMQTQPSAVGYISMTWQGRFPCMLQPPQRTVAAFGNSAGSSGLGKAECERLKLSKPGTLKGGWMQHVL